MTATKAVFRIVAAPILSPPLSCFLSSSHSLAFSPPSLFINFLSRMTNEVSCTVYLVAVLWGLTRIDSQRCALITRTLRSIYCLTHLTSFSTLPTAVKLPVIKLKAVQANAWDAHCWQTVCQSTTWNCTYQAKHANSQYYVVLMRSTGGLVWCSTRM